MVLLQALEDIESQPIQSMAFAEAEAFFVRQGAWAKSRAIIADFLDVRCDQLEAIGRRFIEARREKATGNGDSAVRSLIRVAKAQNKARRMCERHSKPPTTNLDVIWKNAA
jgi:hypothetical protein